MFIESSAPRVNGDKARLSSPVYSATPLGPLGSQCVTFWYHMFGQDIGTLNVYVRSGGKDQKVWSKTGNQGDKWYVASASIAAQPKALWQVVFEGIRGQNWRGDIAIDDVKITQGACPTPGMVLLSSIHVIATV